MGGDTNSRVEGQNIGRPGQIRGVRRNEGQEGAHEVDKMDIEVNSHEGKIGNVEGRGLGGGGG